MCSRKWFDRRFDLGKPASILPGLIDRLRSAPSRVERSVSSASATILGRRSSGRWSIQEHVGHLADLEPLWEGRVEDLIQGRRALRPADLENRATWEASHNDRPIGGILDDFRSRRERLVARIEGMSEEEMSATAEHPRLEQPMTVVDLAYFVAEHDDHHLATIDELRSSTETEEGRGG